MTQADNNFKPPQTIETLNSRKVSVLVVLIAIILTILGVLLGYVVGIATGIDAGGRIGKLIGQSIGIIIFGLIVVAIFQFFKRFRNQRSRWKIYCWSLLIGCLGSIGNLIQLFSPPTTGG